MSEEDIRDLVDFLAANPDAGEEIVGTSGCRKVRFAIRGNNKGKEWWRSNDHTLFRSKYPGVSAGRLRKKSESDPYQSRA
ncbi:MAG: hypothetical protein R3D02_06115 [Hyphomicrobiales bacterium]